MKPLREGVRAYVRLGPGVPRVDRLVLPATNPDRAYRHAKLMRHRRTRRRTRRRSRHASAQTGRSAGSEARWSAQSHGRSPNGRGRAAARHRTIAERRGGTAGGVGWSSSGSSGARRLNSIRRLSGVRRRYVLGEAVAHRGRRIRDVAAMRRIVLPHALRARRAVPETVAAAVHVDGALVPVRACPPVVIG
jgi:hypothetical protein